MATDLGVLLALQDPVEERLVRAINAAPGLVVTRRCADLEEVLGAAVAGLGVIAVVESNGVDRPLVDRLSRSGVRVLVIAEAAEHSRVEQIGAWAAVPEADLVALIRDVARQGGSAPPAELTPEEPREPADADPETRARIIAVWGAGGSPGRSSIAVNLAHELAAGGQETILIDADVWGASLAPMLGVLEDSAGLAAAIRAADQGTLDRPSLARIAPRIAPGLRLLTGLPRASRWREVGRASVEVVLEVARRLGHWVVIDTPVLVPDEDTSYAPLRGAHRNQVAHTVLGAAEEILIVGAAEPIGIERLVQTVLDADDLDASGRRTVVVNRVRTSAAGPRAEASVRETLARFAGTTDVALIPDDRPMADRALLRASAWVQVAPHSAALGGVRDLARRLGGEPATGRRRGGLPRRRAAGRAGS